MSEGESPAVPVWDELPASTKAWLADENRDMELAGIDLGVRKYREARDTGMANQTPEQRLVVSAMAKLVPAIERRQEELIASLARKGRPAHSGPALLALPAEAVALIALRSLIVEKFGEERRASKMYRDVADGLALEIKFRAIKEENKKVYAHALEHTKRWDKRTIDLVAKKAGIDKLTWSTEQKLRVGAELVKLVLDNTETLQLRRRLDKGKWRLTFELREEVVASLAKQHEELEILRPFYFPMTVPPRPWGYDYRGGGYVYINEPLVRCAEDEHLTPQKSRIVIDAVNYVASVPRRINDKVLEVAVKLWRQGGGMAGLPLADGEPIPPRPPGPWKSPAVVEWRRIAARAHEKRIKDASKRVATAFKLSMAERCAKYPAIWFPRMLDFRGRCYTFATHLHPQGDDLCRGLLEFAEPVPIGPDGRDILKIHLANCLGVDKVSYDDRIAYATAFMSPYKYGGDFDPLDDRRWMDADSPFAALAAMLALLDPARAARLPVAVDGTCNGLQHLSALGRDPVGGAATNLIPGPKPADVYKDVAQEVSRLVDADCAATPALVDGEAPPCWLWSGKITRSVVKQPVMTTPYGVTKIGMRSQLLSQQVVNELGGKPFVVANYLQEKTWEALGNVIVAGRRIMEWLQEVADACSEINQPVTWTTPIGFTVSQKYVQRVSRVIRTALSKVNVKVPADSRKVAKRPQVRGISPNYIHSLDGSHNLQTALRCEEHGMAFDSIHDAYVTHAAHVRRMSRLLREEFVTMYQDDLLLAFKAEVEAATGLTLPDPPPQGDLDVSLVLKSPYFFG